MRTLVENVTGVPMGEAWPLRVLSPFCDVHTAEVNEEPARVCFWMFQSTVESRAIETDWPALTSKAPRGLQDMVPVKGKGVLTPALLRILEI